MQQPILITIDGDWIENLFGYSDKKDQDEILGVIESYEEGLREHVNEGVRQILLAATKR